VPRPSSYLGVRHSLEGCAVTVWPARAIRLKCCDKDIPAAQALHPALARPQEGLARRLQGRPGPRLELPRLRRTARRGRPPRQPRHPSRQADRMGLREPARHERPRSRPPHPLRLPQGLGALMSSQGPSRGRNDPLRRNALAFFILRRRAVPGTASGPSSTPTAAPAPSTRPRAAEREAPPSAAPSYGASLHWS